MFHIPVSGGEFCFHNMVLGTIFAWGGNSRGQLGNGLTEEAWTPVPIELPRSQKAKDISAGKLHSLAVVGK
jgi:alpha-tubulin suppressor-like RCC1 family protein